MYTDFRGNVANNALHNKLVGLHYTSLHGESKTEGGSNYSALIGTLASHAMQTLVYRDNDGSVGYNFAPTVSWRRGRADDDGCWFR